MKLDEYLIELVLNVAKQLTLI